MFLDVKRQAKPKVKRKVGKTPQNVPNFQALLSYLNFFSPAPFQSLAPIISNTISNTNSSYFAFSELCARKSAMLHAELRTTRAPLPHQTMEMNGGSSASYLACTPCVPLFCTLFNRDGARRASRLQERAGIISIVRWNLRPVIFGGDTCSTVVSKTITPENLFFSPN